MTRGYIEKSHYANYSPPPSILKNNKDEYLASHKKYKAKMRAYYKTAKKSYRSQELYYNIMATSEIQNEQKLLSNDNVV